MSFTGITYKFSKVSLLSHYLKKKKKTYSTEGHGGSRFTKVILTRLSPATFSCSSVGIPRHSMRYIRYEIYNLSSCSVLGLPLGHLTLGQSILIKCPNYLNWLHLMQRSSNSTPSSLCMNELRTLFLRLSPTTIQRKLILSTCIHSLILLLTTQSL